MNIGRSGGYRQEFFPTRARSGRRERGPESDHRRLGRVSFGYRSGTSKSGGGSSPCEAAACGGRQGELGAQGVQCGGSVVKAEAVAAELLPV